MMNKINDSNDVSKLMATILEEEILNYSINIVEAEKCLKSILKNCSVNAEMHKLAYKLNGEYKILWDNLDKETKKKTTLSRNMSTIGFGYYRWVFIVATFGISYLLELLFKKLEYKKNKEYVTSDKFINACIFVNRNLNFYNKEANSENKE